MPNYKNKYVETCIYPLQFSRNLLFRVLNHVENMLLGVINYCEKYLWG